MAKQKNSIQCGDWHLGWGYGGHDTIGKLTRNEDGTFTWEGSSQGRHGRKWNAGSIYNFKLEGGEIIPLEGNKGTRPVHEELIKAANNLIQNGLQV